MDEKKLVATACRVWRRNWEVWVFCPMWCDGVDLLSFC